MRDDAIEAAGTAFITFSDERDRLRQRIARVEAKMGTPIRALFALGESQRRIAQLLEISPEEVRQLRDAVEADEPSDSAADVSP